MKSFSLIASFASILLASPLVAQQPTSKAPAQPEVTIRINDSLDLKPSPELQKSLDELAAAVQALALRIATDPQLRAAAIQVASGFVATAQQVVTEQSVVLQEALKTAAERIASAQAAQRVQPKKP